MKLIARHPFEALSAITLLYYDLLIIFFDDTSLYSKLVFVLISAGIMAAIFIIGFSFSREMDIFKKRYFGIFLSNRFNKSFFIIKLYYLVSLSIFPLFVASGMEFILTFLFTKVGGITIGFPLPVYSFTAEKLLTLNTISDIVIYSAIVYFIGYTLARNTECET